MSVINEAIQIPAWLLREAVRLAERDGVSLSHWVLLAVAQKIGVVETAADFFRRRAQGAPSLEDALAILDSGPDNPPEPGDELPEDYIPSRAAR